MKRGLSLFLVFNIILGVTLASIQVPILGWSSQKIFNENEINQVYNIEEFRNLLESIIKQRSTELITIFVEPKLRADEISKVFDAYSSEATGGAFKDLKEIIESAQSNLYIPNAESNGHFISSVVSKISNKSVFIAKEDSSKFEIYGANAYINLDKLASDLPKSILSNEQTDILIVVLPDNHNYSQHNDIIARVQSFVGKTEYVSFFTSEAGSIIDMKLSFPEKLVVSTSNLKAEVAPETAAKVEKVLASSNSGYFNYFTGPIIETYFVVSILLAILFMGICCLADLQVPDRYESPKQKVL